MSPVPTQDPEELAESREENREQGIDWKGVVLAAVVTIAALFGLQEWYRTFSLVSQPDYSAAEIGAQVAALKAAQTEALGSGTMPIDRAMRTMIERGRTASALITPEPSTDPAPAAGWMHHPEYEAPPTLGAQPEEVIPEEDVTPDVTPETDVEPAPEAEQPAAPAGETAAQPRPAPQPQQQPGAAAEPREPATERAPTPPPPPAQPAPAQ